MNPHSQKNIIAMLCQQKTELTFLINQDQN